MTRLTLADIDIAARFSQVTRTQAPLAELTQTCISPTIRVMPDAAAVIDLDADGVRGPREAQPLKMKPARRPRDARFGTSAMNGRRQPSSLVAVN
jgi:hypothetical protein